VTTNLPAALIPKLAPAIRAGEPFVAPLLYDRDGLAAALAVSTKTIDRMNAAGKLPRPVRVGVGDRALRWRVAEIASWVEADMPDRETWEAVRV
jgi:predicted DNA-binding transcriptional regulator AlpA